MAAPSASKKPSTEDIYEDGNGLVLYHFHLCYYSQRVFFALHEKKLKFKYHPVNLILGEQFQPSFVKLNPKAEVPVLQDGVKIIPDSNRILDYLEDNFSNGDTPRLKPEKGSAEYHTMERLNSLIDKIGYRSLLCGCLYHPELTEGMKISKQELKTRISKMEAYPSLLSDLSEKHKDLSDVYNSKKEFHQKSLKSFLDVNALKKQFEIVDSVLDDMEKELTVPEGDKEKLYLCGNKFTIADINLSLILHCLQINGLWKKFFWGSKHPLVAKYFKRIQQRDAYRRTINLGSGIFGSLCCLGTREKLAVSLGSAMIVLGVAGLATFLLQRRK